MDEVDEILECIMVISMSAQMLTADEADLHLLSGVVERNSRRALAILRSPNIATEIRERIRQRRNDLKG